MWSGVAGTMIKAALPRKGSCEVHGTKSTPHIHLQPVLAVLMHE